jgi:hypothetical protein
VRRRPPALDHALALTNLRARIEISANDHGLDMYPWLDEFDLGYLVKEGIAPDAFFEITREVGPGKKRRAFLVESELVAVSRPHWRRRLNAYYSFFWSGQYERIFARSLLRLLVVTDDAGRQVEAILEEAQAVDFQPIWVASWSELRKVEPKLVLVAPLWRKPGSERVALFDDLSPASEDVDG